MGPEAYGRTAVVLRPHDSEGLLNYIDPRLRDPPLKWLYMSTDGDGKGAEVKVTLGPVTLGNLSPTRYYRRLTASPRFRAAANAWLRPDPEGMARGQLGRNDLERLKNRVCLKHWPLLDFALGLQDRCDQVASAHRPLQAWVRCRSALLDHVVSPPLPLPNQLVEAGQISERVGMSVASLWGANQMPEVLQLATPWLESTLQSAKTACCWVFSPDRGTDRTDCSANLMMPIPAEEEDQLAGKCQDPAWLMNHKRASDLWAGVRHEQRLVVVSETPA